jgi:hypothetical protein
MDFFKRLTAKKGTPERPLKRPKDEPIPTSGARPDALGFDPVGHSWLDRLRRGQADGYPAFLSGLEDRSERHFYIAGIAEELKDRPNWLDTWVEREPDNPLAWYVRGEHEVRWAWAARSTYRSEYVGAEQWRLFHERLQMALADLATSLRIDPTEPGPRVSMIPIGSGLQMDHGERLRNWHAIADLDPWNVAGGHSMVQTLAPKWSGSLESMFAFAREVSAGAPDGHSIHVILADAHIEALFEARAEDYLRRPNVVEDLRAAAANSIDHPSYAGGRWLARDVNTFAWIANATGDREELRRLLTRSGEWLTYPWTNSPTKVARFRAARRSVGLEA